MKTFFILTLTLLLVSGCMSNNSSPSSADLLLTPNVTFTPSFDQRWIGNGISYSPYRDGESPEFGSLTSTENILEDLQLVAQDWNLIRLYGAGAVSERILQVIQDNNLPIKVMQGAWVSGLQTKVQNDTEVSEAIRLAQTYSDIVVAVNIGNELLVEWSGHRLVTSTSEPDVAQVIAYVKQAQTALEQPVTVMEDYNFWNKPYAPPLAEAVDFIGLHAYAFWNNVPLTDTTGLVSLRWTQQIYQDIQQTYPTKQLVIGETGWPTSRIYNDGSYEGGLVGIASEANQKTFFDAYNNWINAAQIVSFYFVAFDENWKGGWDGPTPEAKAEKNWGLYYSDRTPKQAMQTPE